MRKACVNYGTSSDETIFRYTSHRRESARRRQKNIFDKILPSLPKSERRYGYPRYMKLIDSIQIQPKEDFTGIHYSKTLKNQRPQSILKAVRETNKKQQGIHKSINRSFSRNLAGQVRV